ncbi:hypothetical protein RHIZ404_200800 [Rhizobium sp. EC-SD404]|nr:hypothetical protein RHIZ404_200800 [Rhizobium sp. EC-SD404]
MRPIVALSLAIGIIAIVVGYATIFSTVLN